MRIKIFFGALLLLVLNASALFAQTDPGAPCDYTDVDSNCGPIDSWVIVLAFAAVAFAAMHLLNKRKSVQYPA